MNYDELLIKLKSIESNKISSSNIYGCSLKVVGVKIPILRKFVKENGELIDYSTFKLNEYFEINFIYFLYYLTKIKKFDEQIEFLKKNKKYLYSWAITDSIYQKIEIMDFKKVLKTVKTLINDKEDMLKRIGYLILFKYIKKENLNDIFRLISKNKVKYYVTMVEARLLAEISAYYFNEVYEFLKNSEIYIKIKKKTICKICESFKIDNDKKTLIKKLRTD